MHIPDGFLNPVTAGTMGAVSVAGLGLALRQARVHLPARRVPLMGLAAAFIFAAQMLNFPIGAGTSGHLMGGVLAAVLLGPSAAMVVMSAVLIVQCLLFSDGGLTALGANIFNMGLIGAVTGWGIYRGVLKLIGGALDHAEATGVLHRRLIAAAFAAWCSTVLAAIACSVQLSASGTARWTLAFPAMTWVHMAIGIGEAVITAMVLVSIARTRPELLKAKAEEHGGRVSVFALYGLLLSLGLALFATPWASTRPDGLDATAEKLGFNEHGEGKRKLPALAPDYTMRGIGNETIATSIAGAVGTVVMFGLCFGLARVLVPRQEKP